MDELKYFTVPAIVYIYIFYIFNGFRPMDNHVKRAV